MRPGFTSAFAGWALAFWLACYSGAEATVFPRQYDREIEAAAERWWPRHVEWRWWKAQLYQESRLDPAATSPVGAAGLAQFMPATWAEISAKAGFAGASPRAIGPAINAGAYYMRRLAEGWRSPRPEIDRWDLARASYNAGMGSILAAQDLCDGLPLWSEISPCLAQVTGPRNSHETLTYIERIHRWYGEMVSCRRC